MTTLKIPWPSVNRPRVSDNVFVIPVEKKKIKNPFVLLEGEIRHFHFRGLKQSYETAYWEQKKISVLFNPSSIITANT